MDLRKVQETGGTFFVSIPRDWAKKNGVAKGSLVSIMETDDGCIIVNPQYELDKQIEVAKLKPSPYLQREITGKYLLGFDVIKIESGKRLPPETSETVREAIRNLIGLEIVEEDSSKIVIQFLLEPTIFTPDMILRREYIFISSMHKDIMLSLFERDINLANAVLIRDDEVDRLHFLLVRLLRTAVSNPHISKRMGLSLIDCLDYRMTANYVEAIGDHTCKIAREIIKLPDVRIPDDVLHYIKEISDTVFDMHKNAMQAWISKTYHPIDAVAKGNLAIQTHLSGIEKLLTGKKPEIAAFVSSLINSLSRICDASVDIADIVLPR